MPQDKPLTATFDTHGGYDCMTAAWSLDDGTRTVCEIDLPGLRP